MFTITLTVFVAKKIRTKLCLLPKISGVENLWSDSLRNISDVI